MDTSVIGGCLDREFKEASTELIDKFKRGETIAVTSKLTTLELENAPEEVCAILAEISEENIESKHKDS